MATPAQAQAPAPALTPPTKWLSGEMVVVHPARRHEVPQWPTSPRGCLKADGVYPFSHRDSGGIYIFTDATKLHVLCAIGGSWFRFDDGALMLEKELPLLLPASGVIAQAQAQAAYPGRFQEGDLVEVVPEYQPPPASWDLPWREGAVYRAYIHDAKHGTCQVMLDGKPIERYGPKGLSPINFNAMVFRRFVPAAIKGYQVCCGKTDAHARVGCPVGRRLGLSA